MAQVDPGEQPPVRRGGWVTPSAFRWRADTPPASTITAAGDTCDAAAASCVDLSAPTCSNDALTCDGATWVSCEDGRETARFECTDLDPEAGCAEQESARCVLDPPACTCDFGTTLCDGSVAEWCANGFAVRVDCAEYGASCVPGVDERGGCAIP